MTISARAQQSETTVASKAGLPDAPGLGAGGDDAGQNQWSQSPGKGTCTISGTVLDTNDDVIQGARVVLTNRAGDSSAKCNPAPTGNSNSRHCLQARTS